MTSNERIQKINNGMRNWIVTIIILATLGILTYFIMDKVQNTEPPASSQQTTSEESTASEPEVVYTYPDNIEVNWVKNKVGAYRLDITVTNFNDLISHDEENMQYHFSCDAEEKAFESSKPDVATTGCSPLDFLDEETKALVKNYKIAGNKIGIFFTSVPEKPFAFVGNTGIWEGFMIQLPNE